MNLLTTSALALLLQGVFASSSYQGLVNNHIIAHSIMYKYKDLQLNSIDSYGTPGMNMSEYVRFFLYTRDNIDYFDELWIGDDASVRSSHFNSSKPTTFIIHGYLNNINSEAIQLPMKSLLAESDINVVGVDWSRISVTLLYSVAAAETSHVGAYLGAMLKYMGERGYLAPARTHLVGHSLGAHVAGFAGKALPAWGLARITGLDPAKPGFTGAGPSQRLDASDALFVDCIHTCAGDLGLTGDICQANFYPNGGTNPQPGCLSIDFIGTCSHERSVELFAESADPKHQFRSKSCSSVPDYSGTGCTSSRALMGQPANSSFQGIFYVETHGEYPFAEVIISL